MSISNQEFAQRIGVHFSTASRLRHGQRLPSMEVLDRIHQEFRIPLKVLVDARLKGRKAFSRLLRERVFKEHIAA